MLEILKAVLFGIVEGITEWLPISSTGHMILLNEFVQLDMSASFISMFLVVIQLGAILAVVLLYFDKIYPFESGLKLQAGKVALWSKIILACVPAAVVGLTLDDWIDAHFYNPWTVAIMLILFGFAFIGIENFNKTRQPSTTSLEQISYKDAFLVGVFQLIAAVFPGTSRSGSTILGSIALGWSREVAAEFTFFLAIPVMFGASLLKIAKHGLSFSPHELAVLATGLIVSFIVSIIAIKFLMAYIKKHDFKAFGWYRIVLGVLVLLYFAAK
ncbi:MAG: undecaprenyl-diphosphate phosphatase [Neisseria sp.]|nr:undecaprenyl-diphosphate phosphatase [Neisseria sp.]